MHSLVCGFSDFHCFGIRMEDTPITTETNKHLENARWVYFLLMLLVSKFLTHLKRGKAIVVLYLKERGKFSSSYNFPSSFQLWDDWSTLSLQWCMVFPVPCYYFLLNLFDEIFKVLIKERERSLCQAILLVNTVISKYHFKTLWELTT